MQPLSVLELVFFLLNFSTSLSLPFLFATSFALLCLTSITHSLDLYSHNFSRSLAFSFILQAIQARSNFQSDHNQSVNWILRRKPTETNSGNWRHWKKHALECLLKHCEDASLWLVTSLNLWFYCLLKISFFQLQHLKWNIDWHAITMVNIYSHQKVSKHPAD